MNLFFLEYMEELQELSKAEVIEIFVKAGSTENHYVEYNKMGNLYPFIELKKNKPPE